MSREAISTDRIARPIGPFSSAIRSGDTLYVSGQVALGRDGRLIDGDVAQQTAQIIDNLQAVLQAAGMSLRDVVRVGVYLTDMRDFGAMNDVYAGSFTAPYPARTTVAVAALPLGAKVEMDLVAR